MQSLDLVNFKNGDFECDISLLKPDELFYMRVKSLNNVPDIVLLLITQAAKITSKVILSIPAQDYTNTELIRKFFLMGVGGYALRVAHNPEKWLNHHGIGQFHAGDRDIIDLYHQSIGSIPEGKELTIEFQVGSDVRVLGPTITGLYEFGLRWAVLNPEGAATVERSLQLRDVFEYLKIRGCNKLNVYFPFWKTNFREWDIKTQNTFSGLEYVHIDISNRCTHSCVFCGLYGPEAIDDIKKRHGGSLPESLNKHMKMEIDSEKCLNIINSLPWSVRSIQFGGFGDPLMHDNAVDFISAARTRGFKVEVLSNMEYLNEEDIHALHKLGGSNFYDLHFIANISAGNPELYIKTRPRQTEKNYYKVLNNISHFSKLRQENNESGVNFTVMCVVTTHNCESLLEVAQLAHQIGAKRLWFKPMEIHHNFHKNYVPPKEKLIAMVKGMSAALKFADENKMDVLQRTYCEEIIRRHSGETINV